MQNDINFLHTGMLIVALVNIMKPTKIMNQSILAHLEGFIPGIVSEKSRMKNSRHDIQYL